MLIWHRIRNNYVDPNNAYYSYGGRPHQAMTVEIYIAHFLNWEYPQSHPDHIVRYYVLHDEKRHGAFPRGTRKIKRAAQKLAYERQLTYSGLYFGYANSYRHPRRDGFDRNGHCCCESTWVGWSCSICGAQN